MVRVLSLAAVAVVAAVTAASASEPFVGRWAVSAAACAGLGDQPKGAVLVATASTLSWFGDYCRIGKMYKVGEAVFVQAQCWGASDVPVTLAPRGDRMQVTWNRKRLGEMRRCR